MKEREFEKIKNEDFGGDLIDFIEDTYSSSHDLLYTTPNYIEMEYKTLLKKFKERYPGLSDYALMLIADDISEGNYELEYYNGEDPKNDYFELEVLGYKIEF